MKTFCISGFLFPIFLILTAFALQEVFRKTTFDVFRFNSDILELKTSWVTSSQVSCRNFCINQVEGSTRRKLAQYNPQSSLCHCFLSKNKQLSYFSMTPKITDNIYMYHRKLTYVIYKRSISHPTWWFQPVWSPKSRFQVKNIKNLHSCFNSSFVMSRSM